MTESPIEWHPDADFFRVVCRLGGLGPDGPDPDTKPDLTAREGSVTISSTAPNSILVKTEADGHDRIIGYRGDIYNVDAATGELIAADGTVGLQLLSPNSDRVRPQGYPYKATIKLGVGGPSASVTFDATPTHPDGTVDLARLVVEPIMDGMAPTTVAQQLAAMQAQIDGFGAVAPALVAAEVEDYLAANPIAAAWNRGTIPSGSDLDAYTTPGAWRITTTTGMVNMPASFTGSLEVIQQTSSASQVLQRFTTWEAQPRVFMRRRSASTGWGPWNHESFWKFSLVQGVDLDTVTEVGARAVNYPTHPNLPTARTGVLTVTLGGGITLQRFEPTTGSPASYRRTRSSAGVWSAWVQTGGTTEGAVRAPIGQWSPNLTAKNQDRIVASYSNDRLVGFNGSSLSTLRETRDDGQTWTTLHAFGDSLGWVRQLANGELLASVGSDPAPRSIWLSSGYGTETVTWSQVLTASAPYVYFASAWSLSTHDNIVLLAEYGPKTPTYRGASVDAFARYVYLSLDHGKTWATVFDLGLYLTTDRGLTTTDGQHLHGVAWDPYWDRIWVTFGDDTNGTVFSDDLGATWHTANWGPLPSAPGQFQAVGIAPLPGAVLLGSDGPPNGIWRINRTEGKHSGAYTIEPAWTVANDAGTLTHLCQAIHRVRQAGGTDVWLFGFGAETKPARSFIVATRDGRTFTLLWEDPLEQSAGRGLRTIAGPSLAGELIVRSNDGRDPALWSEWRGPVPIY